MQSFEALRVESGPSAFAMPGMGNPDSSGRVLPVIHSRLSQITFGGQSKGPAEVTSRGMRVRGMRVGDLEVEVQQRLDFMREGRPTCMEYMVVEWWCGGVVVEMSGDDISWGREVCGGGRRSLPTHTPPHALCPCFLIEPRGKALAGLALGGLKRSEDATCKAGRQFSFFISCAR